MTAGLERFGFQDSEYAQNDRPIGLQQTADRTFPMTEDEAR